MRIRRRFKFILYSTLYGLYLTGLADWILQNWFKINLGFGVAPRPSAIWFLRTHAIFGLTFLMIFGYLIRTHIQPGLRTRRQIVSGLLVLSPIVFLILTVPFLYYAGDESFKQIVAAVHTYVGLVLFLPFLLHSRAEK